MTLQKATPAKLFQKFMALYATLRCMLTIAKHLSTFSDKYVLFTPFHSTSLRSYLLNYLDGFGGLVVSILANGTLVGGFKLGRSRWIFRASGKSSICLPSEGK